ncbi:uncharacterized protein LOC126590369 [Malus sylvestris]|uniref:uncharacterized protein LOC126590369 n=1 Tax=Malus sylvestris TaxID=3752 RepID=UPI0021ACBC62|nr:uncharacterized protein LOC126590369 [Malus sylvestris]
MGIQENDDILGDEQPSQVLQDNAQISEASIDVSFEFTDDYHDSTHFDNVQSNDVNFNLSSSRRNKRKNIQDYDNIVDLNIDGDIMVGQLYSSKKELQKQLAMIAMRKNYEFKVERSTKDRLEIRCVDHNCKWRLHATKLQVSEFFEVRKFETNHSCSLDVVQRDHRQASSSVVGQFIKSKYEGASRVYRPKDIIEDMRAQVGVNMSYEKAWRAREHAFDMIRGSPEESFAALPAYCAMLESKNPGTITHIETDDNNHFLYFFMAMGAFIRGFRGSMRPVVAVDGTFLKGKYLGTLFVAVCHDGQNQIYPLAFGVGDSENDASWTWFLTKLRSAIGEVTDLVFVSDRHGSIGKAVQTVFPEAYHGACMYHVAGNMRNKFGDDETMFNLYYTAAKTYLVSEFNSVMTDIWAIKDGKVGKYLQEIGYHRWARAHFSGKRYNMMTTNIAESMNAKLKDARKLPIIALADHLRGILQEWFNERRNTASSWNSTFTKWAEEKVHKNQNRGLLSSINHYALQVHEADLYHIVDLNAKSCTCRRFDLDQLPCVHATAACRIRNTSVYIMCSKFYTANAIMLAYAEPIWPVGNKSEWSVPEEVHNRVVLPPIRQVVSGRRKTNRIPSQGEEKIVKKCSRCGGTCHNRQTCKNPIRLHSNT